MITAEGLRRTWGPQPWRGYLATTRAADGWAKIVAVDEGWGSEWNVENAGWVEESKPASNGREGELAGTKKRRVWKEVRFPSGANKGRGRRVRADDI